MLREIAYSLTGFVLLAFATEWALTLFDDPREPKRVQPRVPLLGHLLGMMQYGASYYNQTSKKTSAEIYTLNIFNTKLYVANTQRLTPPIMKASKTLTFRPFMQTAVKLMGKASNETYEIFGTDMVNDFSHAMKNSLAPGPYLDEQNLRMGKRAIMDLDALSQTPSVFLLEWARHAVVQASSCGIFGEEHPFRDPAVETGFWTWQGYLPLQMVGLDLLRKGDAAREIVFKAFREYCKAVPDDASHLFRERTRTMREAGICEEDISRQQSTFGTAAFANSIPALYWTIHELFSRPDILEQVRDQVASQAVSGSSDSGFTLDVSSLKTKCPLILSVYQETQRTRHIHANIRKVTADTLLDGKYLLKADNYVQMPGQPIHTNPDIWGSSAEDFDPYRFVPKDAAGRKSVAPSSFLAWGAPPHLCPARQFASTEILLVVALLALRYDLVPANGGEWGGNPAVNTGDLVSMYNPKKDIQVEIKEREKWSGTWSLEMGDSMTRIPLASG
ncbi:hypothetical protein AK830_g9850 [Neonectria ditissima]|uniref:25-hydroxycholesterol 7-alpha-hydroxylase n=1 Tax=Neonectria ditissima TaxID=78410 RepID=A0A0P7B883_9HYPO|nr:hypothetical protein AK830_g9850 [Neonectria ditissima]